VALIVAIIGFADATYLTVEHFQGVIPPCSITSGCEKVLTSSYAEIFGIPVAIFGIIYYLVMAVGIFVYLDTKKEPVLRWTLRLSVFGFIMTLWFIYVQQFVLHSYCQYCLTSALTSTILFIISLVACFKYRPNIQQ